MAHSIKDRDLAFVLTLAIFCPILLILNFCFHVELGIYALFLGILSQLGMTFIIKRLRGRRNHEERR